MKVLLLAGAGVAVLGLIALLIGYPISDTSFGNAMMIDGVIVLCTGLLIMALSVISRQLDRIAAALDGGDGVRPRYPATPAIGPDLVAEPAAPLFPAAETAANTPAAETVIPVISPSEPVPESPPIPAAPAERPRRNLLFESRRRDRPEQKALESKPLEPLPAEPPKPSFDDAWSGGRSGKAQTDSESATEAVAAPEPSTPPATAAPAAVTVIKSGTVDGMAYSLYSDGSIEAQMPQEGLIRFASLDALRDYLENKP